MKRAFVALLAIGLAACAGAADVDTPTEPAAGGTPTATGVALTETLPAPADKTGTPRSGGVLELTPAGEEITPGAQGSQFPVEAVVQDLAERLNVAPGDILVESVEKVIWSDASLGCPLPNVMYAQVLTEGYRIVLEAGGQLYPYHTDTRGSLVLCRSGLPELPVIPIKPGEIMDGQPWMPVGTVEPGEPAY